MSDFVAEHVSQEWDAGFEFENNGYIYKPKGSNGIYFETERDAAHYAVEELIRLMLYRDRAYNTIMNYIRIMHQFVDVLADYRYNCDPHEVTHEGYWFFVKNLNTSEQTKKYYAMVIKTLLYFYDNPAPKKVKILFNNSERPTVRHLKHEDFLKVWRNVEDPTDRIILTLGGRCGLRRDEMYKMRVSDISEEYVLIRGKGHGNGKVRYFPITESIYSELKDYIEYRRIVKENCKKDRSEDYLIIAVSNGGIVTHRSYENIGARIRKLFVDNGIDASVHSLRRHYVKDITTDAPVDMLITICKSMGWSDFQMFLRYVSTDKDKLRNVMENKERDYI